MAFAYIQEDELGTRYDDAKRYMLPLFEPLDEFERIARNKPHPGIDKSLPKVTDGTLAALIQEQPKRVIQQIPTGKVKADSQWLEIVAGYILEHEIIPNSNSVAALIQKCWAITSKTLTYGAQPSFVQFVNRGEYFGTDFTLPYIKDVFLEPGKLSDRDSNVIFLRSYFQPNQIDAIINKENMLAKSAAGRNEKYESGWDTKLLEKCKTLLKDKDAQALTPNERGRTTGKGYIELVTAFQRGVGATFYTFCPLLGNEDNIVRRKKNPDPRGVIPIHYMYANVDLSNPLGRGSVEISGGMQNLLDSEVQSYQYMRALMMNPPIRKRGTFSKATIKYSPNAIWDMGNDPNGLAEPVALESKSLEQFPNNYGLIKSQILNLNSSTDTSVSSESGNPGFSKTQAGVKATEAKLGVSDNYVLRQFESTYEEIMETEINLYFAERSGVQELTIDSDTADKLRQIDENLVSGDNVIRVNYDSETEKLAFKVDPTTSKKADNQEQLALLGEVLKETTEDPTIIASMAEDGYKFNRGEAYREFFQGMSIQNIDKIITKMTPEEQQQAAQAKAAQSQIEDKPSISIAYKDLAGNPAAQQAALKDAGIELDISNFQEAQAASDQKDQLDAVDMAHKHANEQTALSLKAAELQHKVATQDDAHTIASSDAATRVADVHHKMITAQQAAEQAAQTHDLAVNNASSSQDLASKTHELAVKNSNKPVIPAKAGVK